MVWGKNSLGRSHSRRRIVPIVYLIIGRGILRNLLFRRRWISPIIIKIVTIIIKNITPITTIKITPVITKSITSMILVVLILASKKG
jgi:hypothetical protein